MQHLSSLISEVNLALMSNVIGDDTDIKKDVYGSVAELVKTKIQKLKDKEIVKNLEKINIDRKLLKKPVMTVPYNVSLNSMSKQLVEEGFFERVFSNLCGNKSYYYIVNSSILKDKESNLTLTATEWGHFTVILYYAIYEKYPPLKELKKYFYNLIEFLFLIDHPIF